MPNSIILHPREARAAAAGTLGVVVRVCKGHPDLSKENPYEERFYTVLNDGKRIMPDWAIEDLIEHSPFGPPGTKLWAKETWSPIPNNKPSGYCTDPKWVNRTAWYAVDNDKPMWGGIWKSPVVMAEHYSRFTLTVGETRVKRVQDATENEAIACGFKESECDDVSWTPPENLWSHLKPQRNDWVWLANVEVSRK